MSQSTQLSYLYEGNPKVFSVLNILSTYSQLDVTNFNQKLDIDNFFKKWPSITYKYYNQFPMITATPSAVNTTLLSTYDVSTAYSLIMTTTGSRTALTATEMTNLLNKLTSAVGPTMNQTYVNSTPFDTLMSNFLLNLSNFHKSIGIFNFTNLMTTVVNNANALQSAAVPSNTDFAAYKYKVGTELTAALHVQTYASESSDSLFLAVNKACSEALMEVFNIYNNSPDRIRQLLEVFVDINTMQRTDTLTKTDPVTNTTTNYTTEPLTNEKWYMLLSGTILKKLVIPANQLPFDPVAANRVKVLLVEVYLKSCYHLIHASMIIMLIGKFNVMGDFINARHSALALCVFTYMLLKRIVTLATNTSSTIVIPEMLSTTMPTAIATFVGVLSKPKVIIEDNAGVSMDDVNRRVIKDLQTLSAKTQDASEDIESLRTSIHNNQLALQTTLSANAANAKRIYWTNVEVIVLCVVLLVVFILCSTLLLMQKTLAGVAFSGIVIFVVLGYMFIDMIVSFIRSNA